MINPKLLVASAILVSLSMTACSDTTAPTQQGLFVKSSQGGTLHLTKECSEYTGAANDHCTVIKANLKIIAANSQVFYLSKADVVQGTYDGDVELRTTEGSIGFGHCIVPDLFATVRGTVIGRCSFSGGTGQLEGFHAELVVSVGKSPGWADWDGKYSFGSGY